MNERIFKIFDVVPSKGRTYREVLHNPENHDINIWRVSPGDWIYPHIHPHNDDIWYIVLGVGEYYITSNEKITVKPGDIAVASPGDVHGIFNSGSEDLVVFSVLFPLPVEMVDAPGFVYPV